MNTPTTEATRGGQMVPTAHEKTEWSRLAQAAYRDGRNNTGHRFSAAAALRVGESIATEDFDALQTQYREWLNGGFPARRAMVTADRFMGFPIGEFRAEERRSLTVHLEDAGKFDVSAPGCVTDPATVWAGRFDTFGEAQTVADGLNRVWKTAPQATPAEVVAFVMQERGTVLGALLTLTNASEVERATREEHFVKPNAAAWRSARYSHGLAIGEAREVLAAANF